MSRLPMTISFVLALLCLSFFTGGSREALAQDVGEAKRLRVLFVMDTDADIIGDGVRTNLANLTKVFNEVRDERKDKFILEQKTGERVTPDEVLSYCKRIKRDHDDALKDEALLVIYSGHGGLDPVRGHFLAMERGHLYRNDLRDALEATDARLIVILTDCCSDMAGVDPSNRRVPAEWKAFRQLFFQHRGLVDITAAQEGTFGWFDNRSGGFFTQCLTKLLCEPIEALDGNGDQFVDWGEFSYRLMEDTNALFVRARDPARADHKIRKFDSQFPLTYTDGFSSTGDAHWYIASRGRLHADQGDRYAKQAQSLVDASDRLTCASTTRIVLALQDARRSHLSAQLYYVTASNAAREMNADLSDVKLFAQQASEQLRLGDAMKSSATRVVDLLELELRRQQRLSNLVGEVNALRARISNSER